MNFSKVLTNLHSSLKPENVSVSMFREKIGEVFGEKFKHM